MLAIPMKLPSVANLREHWATKARRVKAQRNAVALAMKSERVLLGQLRAWLALGMAVRVVLSRVSPRELDDDNLVSAFKAVRDEVAKQLGVDDRSKQVQWQCIQAPGVGLAPLVLVTIGVPKIANGLGRNP